MDNEYKVDIELMAPIEPCCRYIEKFLPDEEISLRGIIEKFCHKQKVYKDQLFDSDNKVNPYITIAYNGEIIDRTEYEHIIVHDNDEIILLASLRGG